MVKWRNIWVKVAYIGIALMGLAAAAGAGNSWG